MSKTLKILLCADDDGIMVKTIENAVSNKGFEENIVLMMKMRNSAASGKRVRKVKTLLCVVGYELGSSNPVSFMVKLVVSLIRLHREVTFASIC